ncbi:hypothetical protein B296_00001419 [Ensete ventricosum]|uniref:Uncharacterized protein n=1 Tax=Ensete ventricosum TaxID=4639 RepID=A0A427AXU4_ENSVE|nr:hypothetical protein B296_00001419 [Ensete ventricosum]
MKLQPDNVPKSSLRIGPGLDDAVGSRREFARRFAKGIEKLTWSTIGRSPEEDQMTYRKNIKCYHIGESWVLV